ncbi:MAG: hypothetical protein JNJ83_07500 [Verrucomicrobiaceae bacterium]|nr:hypothetical protein [Verrucomicrobiaceae bacterium]
MNVARSQSKVFFGLVSIGLIGLGLLGSWSLATKEFRLALFGHHSMATVVKVEKITTSTSSKWERKGFKKVAVSRGSDLEFMTLEFDPGNGRMTQVETLATFNTEAKLGDKHPLIYLKSDPENAKIYSAKQLWLPMVVGTLFSLLCLLFGGFAARRTLAFSREIQPGVARYAVG